MNNVQYKVFEFAPQPRPRKTKLVLGTTETGPKKSFEKLDNFLHELSRRCATYVTSTRRTSVYKDPIFFIDRAHEATLSKLAIYGV